MITEISIKQLREMKGFSQEYMAEQLRISQPAYCKIENGISRTKDENYRILSAILEIDIEYVKSNKIPVFFYIDNKEFGLSTEKALQNELTKSILTNISEQRSYLLKIVKSMA